MTQGFPTPSIAHPRQGCLAKMVEQRTTRDHHAHLKVDFVDISLHDRRSMAGHFSPIAAAPIAILSSNGILLCRQLLGNKGGKQQWLDRKTRVKCQRLAVAGQMLEVRARKLGESDEYSHRVELWDEEGSIMGTIDYLFVDVGAEIEKSRL